MTKLIIYCYYNISVPQHDASNMKYKDFNFTEEFVNLNGLINVLHNIIRFSFLPKRPVCFWCRQVSFQDRIWSHSPPVQCSSEKGQKLR